MLRTPRRSTDAPATSLREDQVDLSSIVLFSDVESWVVPLRTTRAINAVRSAMFDFAGLPLIPGLAGWTLASRSNDLLVDGQAQDHVFWPASLTGGSVLTQYDDGPMGRLDTPFACPIPLLPLEWDYVPVLDPLNDTGFSPLLPISTLWNQTQLCQLWTGITRASIDLSLATPTQAEQISLLTSIQETSRITQAGKAALSRSIKREVWSIYALGTSRALVLTDPDAGLKALIACLSHPSLVGSAPFERLWIQLMAHVGLASEHPSRTVNAILRHAHACGWGLAQPGALDWLSQPELRAPGAPNDAWDDVLGTPSTPWIAQAARCIAAYVSPSIQSPTQRVEALLCCLSGSFDLNASEQDVAISFVASWVYSLSYTRTQPGTHDLALPPPLVRRVMVRCTELSLTCAPLLASTQRGIQRLDGCMDALLHRLDQLGAPDHLPTYAVSNSQAEKERAHLLRIYLLANLPSYNDTRKVKQALDQAITALPHSITIWTLCLRWSFHHLRNVQRNHSNLSSSREVRRTERDAKDLVWRSIAACPGSKAVWLEAMALAGLVVKEGVSPLVDLALERELRLYVAPPY